MTSEPSGLVPDWPRKRDFAVPMNPGGNTPKTVWLRIAVTLPEGDGPFPLVVINHGSPRSAASRRSTARYPAATKWFTARGYAVAVPNRRGYADSGGGYSEGFGRCKDPNYRAAGLETAKDIAAVVKFLQKNPLLRSDRVVVVGQSAGGWGALAVASLNLPGVIGVINFAGGRGSPASGQNCVPQRLVEAAAAYGSKARTPSLWVYTKNDRYFSATISRSMYQAYRKATRSQSTYLLAKPYGRDGHSLFASRKGPDTWGPLIEPYLARF